MDKPTTTAPIVNDPLEYGKDGRGAEPPAYEHMQQQVIVDRVLNSEGGLLPPVQVRTKIDADGGETTILNPHSKPVVCPNHKYRLEPTCTAYCCSFFCFPCGLLSCISPCCWEKRCKHCRLGPQDL
eukprot:jgi/Chlat1/7360/Chrsp59S06981